MFRIRIILMRIRIRGSASGMMDPDPGPVLDPIRIRPKIEQILIFFFLIFSVYGFKLINDVFFVVILSLLFAYIKQN